MRIKVICIGNILLLDEGVGPDVARYLVQRWELPDCVEVIDRGCMGMGILNDLRGCDFALVCDATDVPGEPAGKLWSFEPDDVALTPAGATSLHDMRFGDVLHSAELLGIMCRGHCLGLQVENISPSEFVIALTPRVAAAMPLLAATAVRYLAGRFDLDIPDALATADPFRAGLPNAGARTFGEAGVRADGDQVDEGTLAAMPHVELPEVLGEPDADVMTEYLIAGLIAVGAHVGRHEGQGSGLTTVGWTCPDADPGRLSAIADNFGLRIGPDGSLTAHVNPRITDYDCDALIGAIAELTR